MFLYQLPSYHMVIKGSVIVPLLLLFLTPQLGFGRLSKKCLQTR